MFGDCCQSGSYQDINLIAKTLEGRCRDLESLFSEVIRTLNAWQLHFFSVLKKTHWLKEGRMVE